MAASSAPTPPAPPPAGPPRFDPWSGRRSGGFKWYAVSSVVHIGLLVLFATATITVLRESEEVRVKVLDDELVGEEFLDGMPSLQDVAGALKMEPTRPQRAAPAGPKVQNVRAPEMPTLAGIGPKLGRGPVIDELATNISYGGGGVGGLGGGFGDYVGGLRKVGLDLVLVIDTTDSMQFVIDEVKAKLSALVGAIQRMVPTSRIGIVVYRDKGDDYVVRWSDLSFQTAKLQEFLSHISAGGGGDWEEAVKEALETAIHDLSWRKQSKKIIILVGDAPPHPWEVDEVHALVKEFRRGGGNISTIDVTQRAHDRFARAMWKSLHGKKPYEPSPLPDFYKEVATAFGEIARHGGGELIRLEAEKALIRQVVELTFGSRWKVEMAKFLQELS